MKHIVWALIAISFSGISWAHDFWLAPETYAASKHENVKTSIMIGHPEDRMSWPIQPHRVVALRSLGPNGIKDHQASLSFFSALKYLPLTFDSDGLHILTIETTNAVSTLQAEKFNAYVEEEGLTPIKLDRIAKNTTETPGVETYSRRGKALIHVGAIGAADPHYLSRPLGLTLEIVPQEHPVRVKAGEKMTSQVFYRGQPMSGVTIGLIDLSSDKGLVEISHTDKKGYVSFKRPDTGNWMLHAVWSDPLEGSQKADYDTIFSSLSFSVDGGL